MTARMIFVLIVVIGGLYTGVTFLARIERSEIGQEANRHFKAGLDLYKKKQPANAAEEFRRAWTLERNNPDYQLELAAALLESGELDDAQALLDDALRRYPNNGRANLLQARLFRQQNRFAESDSSYHRAVYGTWQADAPNRRLQARLELISALNARGDHKQLLAELLPIEAETKEFDVRKQVAAYFVAAGATERAAAAYKSLLIEQPGDSSLYAGLGNAELVAGNYIAALKSFQQAYRINPGSAALQQSMQLCAGLVAIDPTPRRLPFREKFERSNRILGMVRESVAGCALLGQTPDYTDREVTNEAAEQRLQAAEQLWHGCPHKKSDLLTVLMNKVNYESP